jgi:tRNA A37 threonylcarbamoyladenosine biosynthesis protein TsaE
VNSERNRTAKGAKEGNELVVLAGKVAAGKTTRLGRLLAKA